LEREVLDGVDIMTGPYHYARFRWWKNIDLTEAAEELAKDFAVKRIAMPEGTPHEIAPYQDERDVLIVRADTLMATLSATHAVLSQKESAPFTSRDLELRKKILELYPRNRPTPFPWSFSIEPKFEVAE